MFKQNGLSLEQAPPISVVLRFFVTATLFGLFTGVIFWNYGGDIFLPQTAAARITTHLFALGVMASFMLGALFQMLPVIVGVVLQTPMRKATFVHLTFTVGVIMLLLAFRTTQRAYFIAAALLLGTALLYAVALMLLNLAKLPGHSPSSRGMQIALTAFTLTILAGLYMLLALGGLHGGSAYLAVKEVHYSFGLFGWVALLIVSISYQVVEMFYVTPPFPRLMTRYLTWSLFVLLLIKALILLGGFTAIWVDVAIALLMTFYGVTTILRLQKRKRPTSDATVWFWRLGMGMLIVTMLLLLLDLFHPLPFAQKLSYVTFTFFALSVVLAMVYKIVPFLTWFHLSNQGYMMAPMMHDIIHPKRIKRHFWIHVALILSAVAALLYPPLFKVTALLLIASFGWLLYHLLYAIYLYRHTQKHTEKFSFK